MIVCLAAPLLPRASSFSGTFDASDPDTSDTRAAAVAAAIEAGRYTEAVAAARAWNAELEQAALASGASADAELASVRALIALVDSLCLDGHGADAETRALAARASIIAAGAQTQDPRLAAETERVNAAVLVASGDYEDGIARYRRALAALTIPRRASSSQAAASRRAPRTAAASTPPPSSRLATASPASPAAPAALASPVASGAPASEASSPSPSPSASAPTAAAVAAAAATEAGEIEAARQRPRAGLGEGLRLAGRYAEAAGVLEQVRAVRAADERAHPLALAAVLERIASIDMRQGRLAEARANLQRALAIHEARGADHPQLADIDNSFGDLEWIEGKLAAARDWHARAADVAARTLDPEHPQLSIYLRNLGAAIRELGDTERSQATLERARAIAVRRLGSTHPEVAWTLNELAITARNQGDYLEARKHYEGALAIIETRFGPSHLRAATLLHNLALLCQELGDLDRAILLERRALRIWEQREGPTQRNAGRASSALAGMYASGGSYARARSLYERALTIRERRSGREHREVANTLSDLAAVLMQFGHLAEARARLARALDIWERAGVRDDPPFVMAMATRGLLEAESGDLPAARATLQQALASHERMFGTANPDVARLRVSLGAVLADLGDAPDALALATAAEASGRAHLQLTMRDLSERLALAYAAARPRGLDLAASIITRGAAAPGASVAVLDQLIQSRGVVLDEMAARHRIESATEPGLVARIGALASARQRLANLTVRGPEGQSPERFADVVAQARLRKEEAETALAESSVEFRKEQARSHVTLASVRAALQPGEALVSFLRFDAFPPRGAGGAVGASAGTAASSGAASVASAAASPSASAAPASAVLASASASTSGAGGASGAAPGAAATNAHPAKRTPTPTSARRASTPAQASGQTSGRTSGQAPARAARGGPAYVAFVLRAESPEIQVVPIGRARDVDADIVRWRDEARAGLLREARTLAAAERAVRQTGLALRRRVWDPLAPHLRDARRVFIVPDGPLNLVSFAALPLDAPSNAFLVEEGPTLHYLSAERDLVRPDAPPRSGAGLLALGAPSFDARLSPASDRSAAAGRSTAPAAAPAGTGDSRTTDNSPALPIQPAAPASVSTPTPTSATATTPAYTPTPTPTPAQTSTSSPASAPARPPEPPARRASAAVEQTRALPAGLSEPGCLSLQSVRFDTLPGSLREIQEVARIWEETAQPPVAGAAAGAVSDAPGSRAASLSTSLSTSRAASTASAAAPTSESASTSTSTSATEPAPAAATTVSTSTLPSLPTSRSATAGVAAPNDASQLTASARGDAAVDMLTRAAASERAFKAQAPGRRVLHLATHGFFLGGPCAPAAMPGTRAVGGLSGRVVGTPAPGVGLAPPAAVIDNPLMLSGLAFAGVNRRAQARADDDDGILTAEEVAALRLEGVEWAVLSACDTGLGAIARGEGVFGLRRAFQIAGVRTVILSLWAVEDRSAVHWMRALYEHRRRDGLDTADAVRAASLDVLRQRRARGESVHPFFWAGFVATGDWR